MKFIIIDIGSFSVGKNSLKSYSEFTYLVVVFSFWRCINRCYGFYMSGYF